MGMDTDADTDADASADADGGTSTGTGARARPAFYTPEQIASGLQITPRALYRLEADGNFPAGMRLTRKMVRYDSRKVDAWLGERGFTGPGLAA
jgi:predicted DNA-binding transcriptional regulator AlpA